MYRVHWKLNGVSGHSGWMHTKEAALSWAHLLNKGHGPNTHWIVKRRWWHWFI